MGVVFLMEGGGVGPLRMGLDIELAIASTGLSLSQVKVREYITTFYQVWAICCNIQFAKMPRWYLHVFIFLISPALLLILSLLLIPGQEEEYVVVSSAYLYVKVAPESYSWQHHRRDAYQ